MSKARRWTMSLLIAICSGAFGSPVAAFAAAGVAEVGDGSLNVRSGPSTGYPVVRKVRDDTELDVSCAVAGQMISGTVGRSATWDRLTDGRYISDAYVRWPGGRPAIAPCGDSTAGGPVAGAVTATRVNLRDNASTLRAPVGRLRAGKAIPVVCQLAGEPIDGVSGITSLWDQLASGQFVTDAYVRWTGGRPYVPWCSFSASGVPEAGEAFVSWAAGYAREMKAIYQVPAAVTLAQAILESGWGRSGLTQDGNSYFGMKCFDTPGARATGCRPYSTQECAGSGCFATTAHFRVYDSVRASFVDHSYSISSLSRYRGAFAYTNDPDRFADAIARAGYATSPTYARDLIRVMRQFDLYRFDSVV